MPNWNKKSVLITFLSRTLDACVSYLNWKMLSETSNLKFILENIAFSKNQLFLLWFKFMDQKDDKDIEHLR